MELKGSNLGGEPMSLFRSILVGYDGSREAQRALRVAVALASDLGGEVHVLQVVRTPAHAETVEEQEEAARAERLNLSQGLNSALEPGQSVNPFTTHVIFDDNPAKAIADFAEEHGVDLIVTGSHGREQSTHRGLGHSLEALVRRRPCPILVV